MGEADSKGRRILEAINLAATATSTTQARTHNTHNTHPHKSKTKTKKGRTCDVARADDVRALAAFASDSFGRVDLWLNNAGTNAYSYAPLLESSDADLERIVDTNVLGVMLCCREAIKLMRSQPRGGHVFNMDGAGADGGATPRFAAYGATKRSLVQLGKSLEAELKLLGIKNVGVHNLSPGMVTTELLMSGADTPVAKFFINCLAEEPADVAAYLVPRVRAVPREAAAAAAGPFGLGGALPSLNGGGGGGGGSNGSNGAAATTYAVGSGTYVQYLTKPKAYAQILRRLVLGERKNRFVREDQKFP